MPRQVVKVTRVTKDEVKFTFKSQANPHSVHYVSHAKWAELAANTVDKGHRFIPAP